MKKMKKFLAMLLALVMVMGMSVTTFATNPTIDKKTTNVNGTKNDTGTITVSGFGAGTGINADDVSKLTVNAYRVIKADYNNNRPNTEEDDNGLFSGYSLVYPNTLPDVDGDFIAGDGENQINEATLASVLAAIKNANATSIQLKSTDGSSFSAEVPVGTYLVEISGSDSRIYSNVLVSVRYELNNNNTGNILEQYNVNVIENGNAWVKVQNKPSFDKVITNSDLNDNKANTTNIGGTVDYQITADIPSFTGPHPVFKISDTLTNLTYTQGTLKIYTRVKGESEKEKWQELEAGKYTTDPVNMENNTNDVHAFTINFVKENDGVKVYGLSDALTAGRNELVITYSATLDESANVSGIANPNTAKLKYTDNSNVEINDGNLPEEESQTKTYTFDIDGTANGTKTDQIIAKVDGEIKKGTVDNNDLLKDAVFTLYSATKSGDTVIKGNPYTEFYRLGTGDTYVKATDGKVTSNDRDKTKVNNISIKGLPVGVYILQETEAPDGYSLNTHEYVIEVKATVENSLLTEWSVWIDGVQTSTFTVNQKADPTTHIITSNGTTITTGEVTAAVIETLRIPNTKLAQLPSTGGIGTTIFTFGGCAIMIIAAGLYFATRRKSTK